MGRRGGGRRPPQPAQNRPMAPVQAPAQRQPVPAPQQAVAQGPPQVAVPQGQVQAPTKSWADIAAKSPPKATAKVEAPVEAPVVAPVRAPVVDPAEQRKLNNIFRDLDKGKRKPEAERFGSGSTADAVRHELQNPGARVGGRSHSQKAEEYKKALDNWVARNPDAPANLIQEAQERSKDLQDALDGN
jgi:hypothetical protein